MAKTLKRKNKKLLKKKKFNKSRRFKKLSKKRGKRSKKKIKGGAQRFGVMPALANTDVEKKLDKDGNLVQTKNLSDQTPIQRSSSYSSQDSTTSDFNTGVRNVNSQMSRNVRKNLVGEPTPMTTNEIVDELKIRRRINELKAHSNPFKKLKGHLWGLMPRTQTANRLLQTANQSLSAADDTDLSFNRSSSSSSTSPSSTSPSFDNLDNNYSDGESKSETTDPFKITEV